ncbi:hypothetical protein KALB_4824 [Kutzneria albida DSM 43870]|uniref:Metallo-beta-lactamase domain-containing protein n=1 Tax=Kutzneria albida DSM 43870 TaxID=1449976 RepID=W5WCE2_9PSEU|nr:hypothetical protein KALB_4824 [Kutzneria albida DSM 43870]
MFWICPTCGAHYPDTEQPPAECVLCEDERQWVPPTGQRWTTLAELAAAGHRADIREVEPGLLGIGVTPDLGVGQRGLLLRTDQGNLLWDPPAYLDEQAKQAVREAGGLAVVTSSHPHMYGALAEWSHEFGAEVVLPEADVHWLQRTDVRVRTWSGTEQVLPGVTLVQCGGHFPGSTALHWAHEGGVLLTGDTIMVTPGEDRLTFMWSAPNRLPLPEKQVRGIVAALRDYPFERVYGGWWTPALRSGGSRVLHNSAERYIQFLRGEVAIDGGVR